MLPEDDTSPTVSVEAIPLTAMIDVKEKRKIVTADISGAFLQT